LVRSQRELAYSERDADASRGAELAWREAAAEGSSVPKVHASCQTTSDEEQLGRRQAITGAKLARGRGSEPTSLDCSAQSASEGEADHSPSLLAFLPPSAVAERPSSDDGVELLGLFDACAAQTRQDDHSAEYRAEMQTLQLQAQGLERKLREARAESQVVSEEWTISEAVSTGTLKNQERAQEHFDAVVGRLEEVTELALSAQLSRRTQPTTRELHEQQAHRFRSESAVLSELRRLGRLCEQVRQDTRHSPAAQRRRISGVRSSGSGQSTPQQATPARRTPPSAQDEPNSLARERERRRRQGLGSALATPAGQQLQQQTGSSAPASPGLVPGAASPSPSRSVAVLTDPELRSAATQTRPWQDPFAQQATHSQEALLSRVTHVLDVQRQLQAGYRAAARQLAELREDRAGHATRADELQDALASRVGELEMATAKAIAGAATETELQSLKQESEMLHMAEEYEGDLFRQASFAEREQAAEAEAMAEELQDCRVQWTLLEATFERRLVDEEISAEKTRCELLQAECGFESALREERDTAAREAEKALAAEATAGQLEALSAEVEAWERAAEGAEEARNAAAETRAALAATGAELIVARVGLAEASAEARCEEQASRLAVGELRTQRDLVAALRSLAGEGNELKLRLERAQAGELWEAIARKEDQEEWEQQWVVLSEQSASVARELGGREAATAAAALAASIGEGAAARLEWERLAEENEQLQRQASDFSTLLRDAHSQVEALQRERAAREALSRQSIGALQRQVSAAQTREAAMLHELQRLREALARGCVAPLADGNFAGEDGEDDVEDEDEVFDVADDDSGDSRIVAAATPDRRRWAVAKQGKQQSLVGGAERTAPRRRRHVDEQDRRQREQLRARGAALEREVSQLKDRIQDLETQLKYHRQEAERRKALITSLQQRCASTSAADRDVGEVLGERDESRRRLQSAQRDLARKDGALHELRHELSEARHHRTELRSKEESAMSRSEADAARAKALRAEASRKERALLEARGEAESLKRQLEAEERRGARVATAVAAAAAAAASSSFAASQGQHHLQQQPQQTTQQSPQQQQHMQQQQQRQRQQQTHQLMSPHPQQHISAAQPHRWCYPASQQVMATPPHPQVLLEPASQEQLCPAGLVSTFAGSATSHSSMPMWAAPRHVIANS